MQISYLGTYYSALVGSDLRLVTYSGLNLKNPLEMTHILNQ